MRPILWGTIWFVIGGVGWIGFSIILAVGGAEPEVKPPAILTALMGIFWFIFFFSIPIAIIAEIIRWIKRKKKK